MLLWCFDSAVSFSTLSYGGGFAVKVLLELLPSNLSAKERRNPAAARKGILGEVCRPG